MKSTLAESQGPSSGKDSLSTWSWFSAEKLSAAADSTPTVARQPLIIMDPPTLVPNIVDHQPVNIVPDDFLSRWQNDENQCLCQILCCEVWIQHQTVQKASCNSAAKLILESILGVQKRSEGLHVSLGHWPQSSVLCHWRVPKQNAKQQALSDKWVTLFSNPATIQLCNWGPSQKQQQQQQQQ